MAMRFTWKREPYETGLQRITGEPYNSAVYKRYFETDTEAKETCKETVIELLKRAEQGQDATKGE